MLKIHPDKNNYEDEEIFNHLTSANQILTNPSLREKYDNWLKSYGEDNSSHMELKENYKNSIDEISFKMPNKRD
ncbi:MAG: DnaJ domain-containing protein, partial [Candidatus Puniceispirillaceae bacterium]